MKTQEASAVPIEMRFSPGPWKATRQVVCHTLMDGYGDGGYTSEASFVQPLGLQVYGPDWEHNRRVSGKGAGYICANARLIAAAPDLYEAVKAALVHVEDAQTRKQLHAALAKVESAVPYPAK